jgi:hypothetical protein
MAGSKAVDAKVAKKGKKRHREIQEIWKTSAWKLQYSRSADCGGKPAEGRH